MADEIPHREKERVIGCLAFGSTLAALGTGAVGLIMGISYVGRENLAPAGAVCLTAAAVAFGLIANAVLRK